MSKPLVSIVIPTYDRLALLIQALDSVAEQTVHDYEVIVVDDGSTEPVGNGVASHRARPRIFRQTRQGPAAARNRGIAEAAGDLIAFLDSDDLWQPTKLEQFLKAMNADPDTRIYYGPMAPILAPGEPVAGRTKPCHAGWITEPLFRSSFVHVPTVVCRKALLTQAGGFDRSLPVCEDYDLWLRLSTHERFGLIETPLALRRLHTNRLSKSCMSRNLAVKAQVLRRFSESDAARGHLPPNVANARLARVYHSAARAAFRSGDFRHASEFSRESRRYGGSLLRNLGYQITADALNRVLGNGHSHDDPDLSPCPSDSSPSRVA